MILSFFIFFSFRVLSSDLVLDLDKESTVDIGSYFDDQPLKYHLYIQNSGEQISNLKLTTSCGCTTLKYKKTKLKRGEKLSINIESDLIGKRGKITKDIEANFRREGRPYKKEFKIDFIVRKNVKDHQTRNLKDVLFNNKCGKCHAEPAKGKLGKDLFVAVCSFCHGENAQGGMAMGFTNVNYYNNYDFERIRSTILHGTTLGEMPGFSNKVGGPLTNEQVDSLMKYFEELKVSITR